MKHDQLQPSEPVVDEFTRARFKIEFGQKDEENRLKSSSVEKEEFDLSQEKVFPDAVEITEITPTVDTKENPDDSANLNRVDRRREGMNESERLDSLVDELRGAAPAPGNTVAMNDLWVAFLCSLDRKDPTPELWKKLRSLGASHALLHRKTSSMIISQYEIVNKSDMGIDQHTLSIPELAARYDVCLSEGVSERASARIIQELSLQTEKHPNQHRVWGNTERMKREAPWLGAEAIELLSQNVRVLRSGHLSQVSAADLVPGDIVFLTSGNEVPADLRVICCADNSTVDISQFSANKYEQRSITSDKMSTCDPFDATNLLFFGTVITSGEIFAIVYRLGRETMLRTMSTAMPMDMRGFTEAIQIRKKEAQCTLKELYDIGFLLKSSPSIAALGSTDCVLLCLPSIILGTEQAQTSIVNMVKAGLRVVVILERASAHDELQNSIQKLQLHSDVKIEEIEESLMKSSASNFIEQLYDMGQQRGRHIEFVDLEVDGGIENVCRTVRHYSLALCWERMDRPNASFHLSTLVEKLRDDDDELNTVLGVFSGRVGHIEAIRTTDIGVVCRAFGQATDAAVRACDGLTWQRKQNNDMSWVLPAIHKVREVHDKASSLNKCCTIL